MCKYKADGMSSRPAAATHRSLTRVRFVIAIWLYSFSENSIDKKNSGWLVGPLALLAAVADAKMRGTENGGTRKTAATERRYIAAPNPSCASPPAVPRRSGVRCAMASRSIQ